MSMPQRPLGDDEVRSRLQKARAKDLSFAAGRILGSMCTDPHPAAVEAWDLFIDANLGDPLLCAGALEIETELREWTSSFLHAPPGTGDSLVVSGGTEANLIALRMARDETGRREVVAPVTVHFSVEKACNALGLRLRKVAVDRHYRLDPDALSEAVGRRTAAVVAVAGNTEFGAVDPVPAAAQVAEDAGAWCHVDAAYGGFVLPFLAPAPPFDLSVEGVSSVCVDAHKMARGVIPCGMLSVRDRSALERHSTATPYVSTERQATVLSTRPGAAAAAAWAAIAAQGLDGLRDQARRCYDNAVWFHDELLAVGAKPIVRPETGVVPIRVRDPQTARRAVAEAGWRVSLVSLVPGIRVVCMPHVQQEPLGRFLKDLLQLGVVA